MKIKYQALITDTIIKESRSKALLLMFVVTTFAIVIGHLTLRYISKEMSGTPLLGVTGINVLTLNFKIINSTNFMVATIFGISVLRSDFQNNIIYQYLTLPISRNEYFLTRILGTWILTMAFYSYAYVLSSILYSIALNQIVFTIYHLLAFLVSSLYLLSVIFLASFFSMFINKLGSLFITVMTSSLSAISFHQFSQLTIKDQFSDLNTLKSLGLIVYYLFPRLSFIDGSASHLLNEEHFINNWHWQIVHFIIITSVYIYFGLKIINKKDF